MKSQRINLLPPRETPKRDWLSLSMMGLYLGVGMGVLLLWMAWALYLNYSTKAQLDDAQKRLTELQVSTDGLQSALQNRKPDVRLIEQQAVYERRIEIKQSLINELIKVSRDNQTGFALAMLDLSASLPEGVWLESIELNNNERKIRLTGYSEAPALLTRLVEQLAGTERFKAFHVISIQSTLQEKEHTHSFELIGQVTLPTSTFIKGAR
jgi:Tfp pilus assembly protein PilN